jgi:hypothetical protein
MSLSIKKLDELFKSKGLIPVRYYTINGKCHFIEITSIKDPSTFVISISSKYKFDISSKDREKDSENIHKLKFIDISNDENDITNSEISDKELLDTYKEVKLNNKNSRNNIIDDIEGSISAHLEKGYKREILLKDMSREEIERVKSIAKQLNRLKLCTQGVFYKLCIIYKNFLCVANNDSEITCFMIHDIEPIDIKKILVTCDLELYYKNSEKILKDIKDIENGIFTIIANNQVSHNKNLKLIFDNISTVIDYPFHIIKSKEKLDKYLDDYYSVLREVTEREKRNIESLFKLENENSDYKGIHSDNEMVKSKTKIEEELKSVTDVKSDLIKTIIEIKENRNNLCMLLDTICFDNTVLCDKINKNLKTIKQTYEVLNNEKEK